MDDILPKLGCLTEALRPVEGCTYVAYGLLVKMIATAHALTRAEQIMLFFQPIILFDYSQKVIIPVYCTYYSNVTDTI